MPANATRCSACGRYSPVFWLALLNIVAAALLASIVYVIFVRLVPEFATTAAWLGQPLSTDLLVQIRVSSFVYTYGIPCLVLIVGPALALGIKKELWRSAGIGKALLVSLSAGIFAMTALLVLDCGIYDSITASVLAWSDQKSDRATEWIAIDSLRRTIEAEYRYRELHPKVGFTCDFGPLNALGGPVRTDLYPRNLGNGFLDLGVYTLSLSHCSGNPVESYRLTAVPGNLGSASHVRTFCSKGSDIIYFSADGKGDTCLNSKSVLPPADTSP